MRNLHVTTALVAIISLGPTLIFAAEPLSMRGTAQEAFGDPKPTTEVLHYPFSQADRHSKSELRLSHSDLERSRLPIAKSDELRLTHGRPVAYYPLRSTHYRSSAFFNNLIANNPYPALALPEQSFILRNAIDLTEAPTNFGGYLAAALAYDPTLAASAYEIAATRAETQSAYFELLPKVDFSARALIRGNSLHNNAAEIDDFFTSSINAEWTLFASGGLLAGIDAAQARELSSKMSYLNAERSRLIEHASIYLRYAASKEQTRILGKTADRLRQIRKTIKKQFDAGFASRTHIAQVETELATLELQVENSRRSEKELGNEWERRAGPVGRKLKVHLPNPSKLIPTNQKTAISRAIAGHPAIAAVEYAARAEEARARVTRSTYLPRVTAYASLEHTDDSIGIPDYSTDLDWQVGVRLNVPIVNLPATSRYRAANSRAIAAHFRAIDTRQQVANQIKSGWIAYDSQRKAAAILNRKKNAQLRAVTGYRKEVDAGLRDVSDLLREEMNYTRVELEILQARIQLLEATYAIAVNMPDMTIAKLVGSR